MNRMWLAVPLTVAAIGLTACSGTAAQTSPLVTEGLTSDSAAAPGGGGSTPATDSAGDESVTDRDIVRTATLTVVLSDPEAAVTHLQELATQESGYVESVASGPGRLPCPGTGECPADTAATSGNAGVTTVVLRVPASAYDEAMNSIQSLGDVVDLAVSAEDVTTQVTDLDARIRTQRDSVERVRQLMQQADTLSDVVQIEQELATRQAELESLESKKRVLAQSVRLATITAVLVPEDAAAQFTDPSTHWWDTPWQAFVSAWQGLIVLLAALSPLIVLAAAAAGVGAAVVRRRRRARASTPAPTSQGAQE